MVRRIIESREKEVKILEIGCGEGILQAELNKDCYNDYLGIDISQIAILKTKNLIDEKTSYMVADIDNFFPDEKYNIIIFNESLYYSHSPISLWGKYMRFLDDNGIIVLSIFDTPPNLKLLEAINQIYPVLESITTVNSRGRWCCSVYQKD